MILTRRQVEWLSNHCLSLNVEAITFILNEPYVRFTNDDTFYRVTDPNEPWPFEEVERR